MRQLTYVGPRTLEWREVQAPRVRGDGEALVRPLAVARCDLDLAILAGNYRNAPPFAFGHEIAGVVTAVGDAVRSVRPGDQVVVPFQISCGSCAPCLRGHTNSCASVSPFAAYGLGTAPEGDHGGGLSDLVRVPFADAMLVPLPDGVSLAAACGASDNIADGWRTVAEPLAREPGADVLVVGGLARSVGLYAAFAAIALGAGRVRFLHPDARDRDLADAVGAETAAVDYAEAGAETAPFPIVVDAAATPAGTHYALRSTAPCGTCTSIHGTPLPAGDSAPALPMNRMYMLGITWNLSRVHGRTMLPPVLHACAHGQLDPLAAGAEQRAFDDAAEVMGLDVPKLILLRG